ncbi:MAG: hypothetical protein JSV85_06620 [Candidatus Bathyarchaeota archaeon]|nr:MAG: hypothetical protein JSV85_06620 [Candidatus Bathyarchaeota archaeon]
MTANIKETNVFSFAEKFKKSSFVSLVSVFAAFNVICDLLLSSPIPFSGGVWFSWVFMITPLSGVLLGPLAGFLASFIGVMVGHSIVFRGSEEFLFTLGAPIGAMVAGFLFRARWREVLVYYLVLLGAYFAAPVAWQLPWWGMWDVFLAFIFLLTIIIAMRKCKNIWNSEAKTKLLHILALCTFVGLEADVLFRIFILIPCQTYQSIYGLDAARMVDLLTLQSFWVAGAVETPIKAALSTIITTIIGPPIIMAAKKVGLPLVKS